MKFLVTGLSGFKGMWLATLLHMEGHQVFGISLADRDPSYLNECFPLGEVHHEFIDIRDLDSISKSISSINPDFVVHFAAASTVTKNSFECVFNNVSTNAIGTLNVLLATESLSNLKGRLIATTDKVYDYSLTKLTENSPLLGHEPYSKSKVLADRVSSTWIENFTSIPTAIVRAGNVIGGGDFTRSRLIPDTFYAIAENGKLTLRNPHQLRPWQYILDCIGSYKTIINAVIDSAISGIWNVGPQHLSNVMVKDLVRLFVKEFGRSPHQVEIAKVTDMEENTAILLETSKFRSDFGHFEDMELTLTIHKTASWYRNYLHGKNPGELMKQELTNYFGV